MTILRQGIVEVTFDKDNIKKYLVEGGFADVTPQKITILAESSLNLTDIDSLLLKEKIEQIDENISNANDSDKELLIERKALMENFN
jgi:F-type H+-transporting ATPase subunit epsilon